MQFPQSICREFISHVGYFLLFATNQAPMTRYTPSRNLPAPQQLEASPGTHMLYDQILYTGYYSLVKILQQQIFILHIY